MIGRTLGFPKKMKFIHRFVDVRSLTDSGSAQHLQFSANGLYDPYLGAGGGQPMYFDQLTALYNHYTVIASKITVRIVPAGTSVQNPYRIILWTNDDTTTTPTVDGIAEQKGAITRLCTGGVNPSQIVLSKGWSLKRTFSGNVASSQFEGNSTTNPTEQSVFQLTFRTLDGVSSVQVYVQTTIEYIAIWKELKDIVQS